MRPNIDIYAVNSVSRDDIVDIILPKNVTLSEKPYSIGI